MKNRKWALLALLGLASVKVSAGADIYEQVRASENVPSAPRSFDHSGVVNPGALKEVVISQSDVNAIVCESGPLVDRTFSQEKPLQYKVGEGTDGRYAFVKLLQKQGPGGEVSYYQDKVELYITCDGEVYSLLLDPQPVPTRKIVLSGGRGDRLRENIEMFKELSLENSAVSLIDKVDFEGDDLPGSFTVSGPSADEAVIRQIVPGVRARLTRTVKPEGIGLIVHEYVILSDLGVETAISEFDVVALHDNSLAARVYPMTLSPHGNGRAFVVERLWR